MPETTTTAPALLEALWTRHHHETRRALRTRIAAGGPVDEDLVDDATSEAFLRLERTIRRDGHPPQDPRTWLRLVARREYLRLIDRRDRIRSTDPTGDSPLTAVADPLADPAQDVIDQASDAAATAALHDAISRLSTRQQDVILRYARGRSYEEVAAELGISRSATNKAIAHAKARLRRNGLLERAIRDWAS